MRKLDPALVALAACAMAIVGAPAASASHVKCGDVITQDTTLDSDLIDCPEYGVVIGAPDVTLDLGGHLIDGLDTQLTFGYEAVEGVSNVAGYDRLTVRNGVIREFQRGVRIGGEERPSQDHVLRDLDISSERGIAVWRPSGMLIESNTIKSREQSVLAPDAQDSAVVDNRVDPISGGGYPSINVAHGIGCRCAGRNLVARNYVGRGDIEVGGAGNVVTRNEVHAGLDAGISVDPFPLPAGSPTGSLVSNNFVTGQFVGLIVSGDSRVVGNKLVGNRSDGIRVLGGSPELIKNKSSGNGDDGIELSGGPFSAGTLISKNRADDNRDLGIEAPGGAVDDGKNKASGNGNPAECIGVACK